MVFNRLRQELYPTISKILQHQEVTSKTIEKLMREREENERAHHINNNKEEEEEENVHKDHEEVVMLPPGLTIPTTSDFLTIQHESEYLSEVRSHFLLF